MSWFRQLRTAWLFLRYVPYVPAFDHEDYWNKDDMAAYSAFMNSPTGQKLRNRCNNLMTRSAVNATQHTQNPIYRNGWASGIAATFSWLDSHLLQISPDQSVSGQPEASEPDASEYFDRMRP